MVERTVQALSKVLLELWTGNVHFCTICEITFLVGDPWKSNVEKFSKNGCNFSDEPCYIYQCHQI